MDPADIVLKKVEMNEGDSVCTRLKKLLLRGFYFCQLNGGYFALYGLMLPGILMNILSAVFNEFQGGCSFPYISEVGREGVNQVIFVTSTAIIIIPWLIFSVFFLFTSWSYAQFVIPNIFYRGFFDLCQLLVFILTTHSNVYFFTTSIYDILSFPEYHGKLTTKLALYGCIAYTIDTVACSLFLPSPWEKMKWTKIIYCILSWVFGLMFGLLNLVKGCPAQKLPMDRCFLMTSEDYCFAKQDPNNLAMTILRYYPRCHTLHFIRGLSEVLHDHSFYK
ncbi:hypothetical protein JH06_5263 [Blastocystis sp. subtype 4]|uniref:hypothetical protein n=1 Tax=Blastocystis sp. subtype 4 TaxID=944170 RepID=UPI0007115F02|nr:hypothetical protein JH06_5263 [Blastocystis sp. subtype 4]KNB41451.1 hypothetical protein JH06_5263 [Blastocystis sp. subtype 4]|eukprot:XP_014524894.1 hypothetical protein JH06_5263 [Blastocystis sp. subtype 4]